LFRSGSRGGEAQFEPLDNLGRFDVATVGDLRHQPEQPAYIVGTEPKLAVGRTSRWGHHHRAAWLVRQAHGGKSNRGQTGAVDGVRLKPFPTATENTPSALREIWGGRRFAEGLG